MRARTRRFLGIACLLTCLAALLYGLLIQEVTVGRKSGEQTSQYTLTGLQLVAKAVTDTLYSENGLVLETSVTEQSTEGSGPACPT